MVGNTGGYAANVLKFCIVGSRVVVNGGCNTKEARVGGRELTYGVALQNGHTPLYIAAWKGHLEVAQLLLDSGANKEAKNEVRGGGAMRG